MPEFVPALLERLAIAAQSHDREAIDAACADLLAWALQSQAGEPLAAPVVKAVRERRCWHALGAVASALLARGNDVEMVRSCLVQSAIDSGELGLAQGLLAQLTARHPDDAELLGLEGRLHKQRFVNAVVEGAPPAVRRQRLEASLGSYLRVYRQTRAGWHGINAIALSMRAERERLGLSSPFDAAAEASALLVAARSDIASGARDPWRYALIMEAALALDLLDDALAGAVGFVSDPSVGPFAYAGALRQLREIWAVDESRVELRTLTSLLEAAIVARHGGASVALRSDAPSARVVREQIMGALAQVEPDLRRSLERPQGLQRVFEGALVAYDSLLAGIACCDAIAWLEHARTRNRKGTGFVLSGELLDPLLGSQPLLVTNAHVLDDDRSTDAMAPANARVCFEQGPDKGRKLGVAEVLWVSPRHELDVCVARLSEPPASSLPAPAQCLPALGERAFLYVVGHARGGPLSFSLMDNLLLDHDQRVLHYRCATEPGSSGSPVFNVDWELVGVHHAGLEAMPRLHGRPGTYAANEGTRFDVIQAAFQRRRAGAGLDDGGA